MFTGLSLGMGEISGRIAKGAEIELNVNAGFDWSSPLELGESIAVNGVCLTVTSIEGKRGFKAFASAETLNKTNLGTSKKVNLERALTLSARLGGHLVTGHVDGQGTVLSVTQSDQSLIIEFAAEKTLMPLIVPKGSICIDGISLTINEVLSNAFSVNIIPHTAGVSTIGSLSSGNKVNLETDIIGKYVQRLMSYNSTGKERQVLSMEMLAQYGFTSPRGV